MKIESSAISMASTRSYQAREEIEQTAITRRHDGSGQDEGEVTAVRVSTARLSVYEASDSAAVFVSSKDGLSVGEERQGGMSSTLLRDVKNGREQAVGSSRISLPQQMASTGKAAMLQQAAAAANANAPVVSGAGGKSARDWISDIRDEVDKDPKIQMLRKCLELLEKATGKPVSSNTRLGGKTVGETLGVSRSAVFSSYQETMASIKLAGPIGIAQNLAPPTSAENPNGYWTRQVLKSGVAVGEEVTGFASTGTVVTSDGRTIDFGITVSMSRSFETAIDVTGREQLFTDPLVINLDTDAASLADVSFHFDLDCDGSAEEISALGRGSGFLALDKNGDGTINDGSELFGAATGDGFAELARYDQDGNGWIDENDEVFSRLKVWVQCGEGEPKLLSLSEADVGAIFLGSQSTQFTLSNSYGDEGGMVRQTGVFLRESGTVGTVQHIDLKT